MWLRKRSFGHLARRHLALIEWGSGGICRRASLHCQAKGDTDLSLMCNLITTNQSEQKKRSQVEKEVLKDKETTLSADKRTRPIGGWFCASLLDQSRSKIIQSL